MASPSRSPHDAATDALRLAPETGGDDPARAARPWKVLVVDDEEQVHLVTRLVLRGFTFEGRPLQLLGAYSGVAARRILRRHPDVAVVLLDVVMEQEDAGLRLVRHVREELGNRKVRIVLCTGQPGRAPEQEVVARHDVNDYRAKTELTPARLRTTVTSALRSWRDLEAVERGREGLRRVVRSHGTLFRWQADAGLVHEVLDDLLALVARPSAAGPAWSGLVARAEGGDPLVVAGRGRFAGAVGGPLAAALPARVCGLARELDRHPRGLFGDHGWLGACRADDGARLLLHLSGGPPLRADERDLVRLHMAGVAMAFRNTHLAREIMDAQKEVIHVLGEMVETRSRETAHHVLRVGRMAALLGGLAGLGGDEQALLRLAAPLHDAGKVGIPDAILEKPGPLTPEETAIMRTHTTIGHAILAKSRRRILRAAARIALEHHERWDGGGYPRGLAGEGIHVHGRIVALVDVFDALSNRRVYRAACPPQEVLEAVAAGRGTHFDPRLTDLLLAHRARFRAVMRAHPEAAAPVRVHRVVA